MQLLKGDINEVWGKGKLKNFFAPVAISSLVVFRIVFGAIMFWEVTRYFKYEWIYRYWIAPDFNFSYAPFNFQPLPEQYMYMLWYALVSMMLAQTAVLSGLQRHATLLNRMFGGILIALAVSVVIT